MSTIEQFLDAWCASYKKRTGIRYRQTAGDAEFLIKSDCLGALEDMDLDKFTMQAVDYLVNRGMIVTVQNAVGRINQIVLAQKPVAPAHEAFDAEAYRKELMEE